MISFRPAGTVLIAGLLSLPALVLAGTCEQLPGFTHLYNSGWGNGLENSRFQSQSAINRGNVSQLQLEWAFALDENQSPHSYPVITGDTLFIGTTNGNLHALDRDSGCVRWTYSAEEQIRTGIAYGRVVDATGEERNLLFFGTFAGNVFAVDGVNGELVWKADVKDHAYIMVTGTPTFHEGNLYVPISSG